MRFLRGIGGVLLLVLAAMKVVGIIVILINGNADHPSSWFLKQSVYALAFASIGVSLLRFGVDENSTDDSSSDASDEID